MKTLHTPHTHFSRCTGVCFINQCPGDTVQTGTGKVDPARKFKWTTTARAQSTLMICVFFLTVKNINIWRFWIRVSNRNSVVRNCTQLFSNYAQLRGIMCNCAQFLGVYRARNCAQIKSTCVGNPILDSIKDWNVVRVRFARKRMRRKLNKEFSKNMLASSCYGDTQNCTVIEKKLFRSVNLHCVTIYYAKK